MAPPAPRILLAGDVLGRLNQLYKRVSTITKTTGPFDAMFCVGQFFPDTSDQLTELMDYTEGRNGQQIPIPTYFTGDYGVGASMVLANASSKPENRGGFKMDGLKICHNLYCLKGSGKVNLHGLSVTYLSGKHPSESQTFGAYSQDEIDALRAWAEEPGIVDLFLTNEWPTGLSNGSDVSEAPPEVTDIACCDSILSELVLEIKPRYHIAGSKGVFYAREPYSNDDAVHVTRFLGLAYVGNKTKQKFIHAISPTPASTMSNTEICMKPPNTTSPPYSVRESINHAKGVEKRPNSSESGAQYWRYDVSTKRQRQDNGNNEMVCYKFLSSGSCLHGEKCNFQHDMNKREQFKRGVCFDFLAKGKCERDPCNYKHGLVDMSQSISRRSKECWFCLSSPNVESHLIICIGEYFYCALPKGALVEDHALIIPIEHTHNALRVEPEAGKELEGFKRALKMYSKNQGKEVVFFEYVSKQHGHTNIQAVPIPLAKASILRGFFTLAAEKLGIKLLVINANKNNSEGKEALIAQYNQTRSFFYVELPDGAVLSHSAEDSEKFSAQLGREVLAGLLNVPDKADWKSCTLSKENEVKAAESFKKRFENFDPTR